MRSGTRLSDADRHELRFDRQQAGAIADFLADELSHQGAASFRLMLDVFPGSLDLTSFDRDGVEITHIHPRPEGKTLSSRLCRNRGGRMTGKDWKQVHAAEAEKVWRHRLVQDGLDEFAHNMRFKREGLAEYGLMKIVNYVAQCARADVLGFDPELLRLSPEEANASILAKARAAVLAGKPVLRIDERGVTRLD